MNKWSFLLIVGLVIGCLTGEGKGNAFLALCKNSITEYSIIIEEKATPDEQFAAGELARFLTEATGAEFQIRQQGAISGSPFIGLSSDSALQPGEWLIKNIGTNIVIKGGRPRGILYGVYEFLERFAGCRWYAEDTQIIPENANIAIPLPLKITGKPAFMRRTIYSPGFYEKGSEGYERRQLFLTRQRRGEEPHYGGRFQYGSPRDNHTLYLYSKDLPDEGFSMSADGKRIRSTGNSGPGQVCFSSPEVRKHFIRKLREYIKYDRKEAEQKNRHYPVFYDISVNDNTSSCHCPDCRKLAEKYGESGLVIDFVNSIARSVKNEYPDIFITTLAYGPAVNAPKNIRAESNVVVRLALLGNELRINKTSRDTLRSLLYPTNADVLKTMKAWREHTDHLAVWDYWNYCTDDIYPYTNTSALAPTFREYRKLGIMNIFAQAELKNGMHYTPRSFYDLRNYVASCLMIDPDRDDRALIREFMQAYYGKAAEPMETYLNYLEKRMSTGNIQLGLIHPTRQPWIDADFFRRTDALLNQAEAAVKDNPGHLAHVKLERLPVDMMAIRVHDRISGPIYNVPKKTLITRCRENIRYAVSLYYPEKLRTQMLASWEKEILHYANKPPLPEKFQGKSVYDYYWTEPHGHRRDYRWTVADPDAAGGAGVEINNFSNAADFHEKSMAFGIFDRLNNKHIIRKTIQKKDLPKDEKYHLYYVGRTLIRNYRLWAHPSWFFVLDLNEAANPGAPDAEYDVYISFKVQGPSYVKGSKLPDAFRVDRVLVVFIPPR